MAGARGRGWRGSRPDRGERPEGGAVDRGLSLRAVSGTVRRFAGCHRRPGPAKHTDVIDHKSPLACRCGGVLARTLNGPAATRGLRVVSATRDPSYQEYAVRLCRQKRFSEPLDDGLLDAPWCPAGVMLAFTYSEVAVSQQLPGPVRTTAASSAPSASSAPAADSSAGRYPNAYGQRDPS